MIVCRYWYDQTVRIRIIVYDVYAMTFNRIALLFDLETRVLRDDIGIFESPVTVAIIHFSFGIGSTGNTSDTGGG